MKRNVKGKGKNECERKRGMRKGSREQKGSRERKEKGERKGKERGIREGKGNAKRKGKSVLSVL